MPHRIVRILAAGMRPLLPALFMLCLAAAPGHAGQADLLPHHDLAVTLYPATHRLAATATITLPACSPRQLSFLLHAGLRPVVATPGATLVSQGRRHGAVALNAFLLTLPAGKKRVTLRYQGAIHQPPSPRGDGHGRDLADTPGTIGPEGVFLSGASGWYPLLPFARTTFRLAVALPPGWQSVSQGARHDAADRIVWEEKTPQEEIYCVAGPFHFFRQPAGTATAMAFLRQDDPELAGRYLAATGRYLALYEKLIGPYPYAKFALVENFWETGFGMPSFTLLGPTVIRLPFILHTSYPHEILHNWWGNSVYVDYEEGNWSEGLTAYLADHLLRERQGEGTEYRRGVLQKYGDYAAQGRDLPLTRFTSRHSSASEAVGYGKALMLFHMLRQELGDHTFIKGLQEFYRTNRFRNASFQDVAQAFSRVAGRDLAPFFRQWVERTGAPLLGVHGVKVREEGGRFRVKGVLSQKQTGEGYDLMMPLAITVEGESAAQMAAVAMTGKEQSFSLLLDKKPLRLDVDPSYDLFRLLDRQESPPALSQLFGARRLLIVLPDKGAVDYRNLAETLRRSGPEDVDVMDAAVVETLPTDRAVLLLGWENRLLPKMQQALAPYGGAITAEGLQLPGQLIARNNSVVAVGRHPANPDHPLGWIATDLPAAIPGLGRKLPHYHKQGYLAFSGVEPTNTAKGIWPVVASPLTVQLGERPMAMGNLPLRAPLIAGQ